MLIIECNLQFEVIRIVIDMIRSSFDNEDKLAGY
jgi:hypothetical protein